MSDEIKVPGLWRIERCVTHVDYDSDCLRCREEVLTTKTENAYKAGFKAAEAVREDERQACWEDFIQVIRNSIKDAPHSVALKALHEAVYLTGWKELGTGDGKPMHKRKGSAVSERSADV